MTLRQTFASRFQLKEEPTIGGLDLDVYRPAAGTGLFVQADACGWAVNENALSATKSTGLITNRPHSGWRDQANQGNHDITPELRLGYSRHWSREDELRHSLPVYTRIVSGGSGDLGSNRWQLAGVGEAQPPIRFLLIFGIDHWMRIVRPKKETTHCSGVHGLRYANRTERMEPWNRRLSRNYHADTAWIDNSESCTTPLRRSRMT